MAMTHIIRLLELIRAIQVVHLEQMRRCHEMIMASKPEDERETFAKYLEDLATAVRVNSKPGDQEAAPKPTKKSPQRS